MNNVKEITLMADVVAKEKGISPQTVLDFLSNGIEVALKKNYPEGSLLQVTIDVDNNEINGWRLFKLVNSIENVEAEMLFNEIEDEDVQDGYVWEPIPIVLGRQQLNIIKQVALQKIKTESRDVQIQDLLDKPYKYYTGTVKIIRKDSLIIDVNGLDLTMPKKNLLPKEMYKPGDKIVFGLQQDPEKKSYFATRTSTEFLEELLKKEIVQIEEGHIEIVRCARNPGFRAKVIVRSNSSKYDAVRLCIGARGVHVKNIQSLLAGEVIEIIEYDSDPAQLLIKCLYPTTVSKIVIDEEEKNIEVAVSDDEISQSIGRGGKNIEIIGQALGWNVFIYSNTQWDNKERTKSIAYTKNFMYLLDCDEELAEYLVTAGYSSIEEIAYFSIDELELDELDEETIASLKENALISIADKVKLAKANSLESLYLLGFDSSDIETLENNKVFSKQDVADLASDELVEILPNIDIELARSIIMTARKE